MPSPCATNAKKWHRRTDSSSSTSSDCTISACYLPIHTSHQHFSTRTPTQTNSSSGCIVHGVSNQLPRELKKLALSFVYFNVVALSVSFCVIIAHVQLSSQAPLRDVGLSNLPFLPWGFRMAEIIMIALSIVLCLVCFFHKHRCIVLRRIFVIAGSVHTIRCLTMLMTSLPAPSVHLHCLPQNYTSLWSVTERSVSMFIGAGMQLNNVHSCGDYIYSGHTVFLTLMVLFITRYTPRRMRILHLVTWLFNIVAMLLIVASREHYSVDVFLAFFAASLTFLYYHVLADAGAARRRNVNFGAVLWIPCFTYFESSIDGAVPNEFAWPSLPWRRRQQDI